MPADRLLAFLREQRRHHALVEDDDGRISGLITLEDVLAELLGGVSDEFKAAQVRAILLSDGRVRIPGVMRLDQAAPVLGAWRGGSENVASYIAAALGRVPETGERVTVDDVEIEIEVVEAGVIASVIVDAQPGSERPA
jgi:CBS domain containing-hemolysin-like protein